MNDLNKTTAGGKWYSVPCALNCGGRCLTKVLIQDGKYVRTKTDDTHEDSWDWPQARACPMGYAQWQKVFGEDRLKYPMKRKSWSSDDPRGELRGCDEWERISWDEALDTIASELKKAKEKYGNQSILYINISMFEGYLGPILGEFGGYVDLSSVDSTGSFAFNPNMYGLANQTVNDRYDNVNSDYIVLYGHNGAWAEFPSAYYLKPAHEQGVKFAYVGPEYNVTAGVFDATWYPVRQGTDTAFLLGVAHTMLKLDVDGSVVNWDFLDKYTIGFDSEHMPEDAKTEENFVGYLMGDYDNVEKNAAWASEICGCPVDLIEEFAQLMGTSNKVAVHTSGAPARNTGAENFPQLLMTLAAMGGHFGSPGNACANDQQYGSFDRGPVLAANGTSRRPFVFNCYAYENPVDLSIPSNELWDAVLGSPFHDCGNALLKMRPCEVKQTDIHVIIGEHQNRLGSFEGTARGIEAYRSVDFVCTNAYWLKTEAKYADIVLPVATRWERHMYSVFTALGLTYRDFALINDKVCDPLYESKSDYDIAVLLAERLGVDHKKWLAEDEKQAWFNSIVDSIVYVADNEDVDESQLVSNSGQSSWMDGLISGNDDDEPQESSGPRYRRLVTITQKDIDEYDVVAKPQQGVITLEQFLKDGIYRYKRDAEGKPGVHIAYQDFVTDPVKNPLPTKSGKFEIYCQTKADWFDEIHEGWPHYQPVSPLPKYLSTVRGYVESFDNWEKKIPGKYPYMVSNSHTLRHSHTDNDNLPYLREAWANPVYISVDDAKSKGVQTGDVIMLINENAKVLRQAQVSRFIMPGTIELPHGCAVEVDEATGIDLAGADNYLCSAAETTSCGSNAWNSTRVDFEKYTGDLKLKPDYKWEPRVPLKS